MCLCRHRCGAGNTSVSMATTGWRANYASGVSMIEWPAYAFRHIADWQAGAAISDGWEAKRTTRGSTSSRGGAAQSSRLRHRISLERGPVRICHDIVFRQQADLQH